MSSNKCHFEEKRHGLDINKNRINYFIVINTMTIIILFIKVIILILFQLFNPKVYSFISQLKHLMQEFPVPKIYRTKSQERWRCKACQFDNLALLEICQMCDSPKQINHQKMLEQYEEQPTIVCQNSVCKQKNPIYAEECSRCKKSLFEQDKYHQNKSNSKNNNQKLKYCRLCRFENDASNKSCVSCEVDLKIKTIPMNPVRGASTPVVYCSDCGHKMEFDFVPMMGRFANIYDYSSYSCLKCEQKNSQTFIDSLCLFCDKKINKKQLNAHKTICQQRLSFYTPQKNPTFARCTKLQIETILHMHKTSEIKHLEREHRLLNRIKKLGFNRNDFQNLHHYIIHYAPIIIHMRVNAHMTFFVKDTHYRNQFQVHKGGSGGRVQWEDRMFDRKHHNATHFERVKYGTMNFTNDPKGVRACVGYGQSYFLLKEHVRDRCTITDMDSASPAATIGTFRFIYHLLEKLSDAELKSAFEGSKGKEMLSNVIGAYKQIQIHGPVQFSKDIERVYVSKNELVTDPANLTALVTEFCKKNKLEYEVFENIQHPHMHGFFGGGIGGGVIKAQSAPSRVIDNKKQFTEQDIEDMELKAKKLGIIRHPFVHPIKKLPKNKK